MRELIALLALAACHSQATRGVGVRTFDGVDPITHAPLPIAVFYPADGAAGARTELGPYTLAAGRDLAAQDGRRPLVVISHGHGGSLWGHHDLAESLARHGYIVAVVEHVGDSWRDQSGFRSDRVLLGRAYQVSATIDAVLADPVLGAHVDPARIGIAGFSAGGYTSLLVVGAHPDFARFDTYCASHADDAEICDGAMRHELASPKPTVDPRVRAAFVMAPFAIVFGPDAFRDVTAPVFLAYGTADRVLRPDFNARAIAPSIATLRTTRVIEGAGHYVFLAPCSPASAKLTPAICEDPPGIDRTRVHAQLDDDAAAFFDASLIR